MNCNLLKVAFGDKGLSAFAFEFWNNDSKSPRTGRIRRRRRIQRFFCWALLPRPFPGAGHFRGFRNDEILIIFPFFLFPFRQILCGRIKFLSCRSRIGTRRHRRRRRSFCGPKNRNRIRRRRLNRNYALDANHQVLHHRRRRRHCPLMRRRRQLGAATRGRHCP